jgi:hypothetical protein
LHEPFVLGWISYMESDLAWLELKLLNSWLLGTRRCKKPTLAWC